MNPSSKPILMDSPEAVPVVAVVSLLDGVVAAVVSVPGAVVGVAGAAVVVVAPSDPPPQAARTVTSPTTRTKATIKSLLLMLSPNSLFWLDSSRDAASPPFSLHG